MTRWLFTLGGAAAGIAQAGLLSRSARRGPGPMLAAARLLIVGVVLLLAAWSGQLVPGAAGWLAGFVATGVVVHRGLR